MTFTEQQLGGFNKIWRSHSGYVHVFVAVYGKEIITGDRESLFLTRVFGFYAFSVTDYGNKYTELSTLP